MTLRRWQGPLPRRWATLTLFVFILLAALLRLVALDRDSLWFDEAISFLTSSLPARSILDNTVESSHPPLYYLTLHYWRMLTIDTDWAMRLLGVFADLLVLPITYALAVELAQQRLLALLATFLVAVSPFHLQYSHELRMYTMLMLLTSTTTLVYLKARQSNGWVWWLLFAAAGLLSIYTHLFAVFVLVAIGFDALVDRHDKQALQRTIVVGVLLFIFFLPWVALVAGESQYGLGSLRPLARQPDAQFWPLKLLGSLTFLVFGYATNVWYVAVAWFLILSTLIIGLIELNKARRQGSVASLRLPLLVILCCVGMPVAIYAFRPFFLPERTLAAASPFLAIFLAWCAGRRGSTLPFQVAAITILLIIGAVVYLAQPPQKPPYRDVARFLEDQAQSGDAILHTSDGSYLPVLCYLSYEPDGLLAGDPDPRKPVHVYEALGGEVWSRKESVQQGKRLWLVVAREHSVDWQNKQADYFADHYPQLATYDFSGISVTLYDLEGSTIAFSP